MMPTSHTIYATFSTRQNAEDAAAALMNYGVRMALVHLVSPAADYSGRSSGVQGETDAVPVSRADMPDDLPVPSFSALGSPVTAAIDLNAGTRIGEDGSVMHQSPGYAYEGLDVEAQDTRSGLFAAHSGASKADAIPAYPEPGGAVVSATLAPGQDPNAIIALLEKWGSVSVQSS